MKVPLSFDTQIQNGYIIHFRLIQHSAFLVEPIVQRHQVGNCVRTSLPPESAFTAAAITDASSESGPDTIEQFDTIDSKPEL